MHGPFSAPESMLGYLFQCRLALLDATRRLSLGTSFAVSIETLDDIVFDTVGSPLELLQAKHRVSRAGNLSDASPDLWKSIRIWADGASTSKWPTDTVHYLVTTGSAPDGSAAALLRESTNRDAPLALKKLTTTATTSKNQSNAAGYAEFQALSEPERLELVSRIVVADRSPHIGAAVDGLARALAFATTREQVPALVQRLEGWWFQQVVAHLHDPSATPILSEELDAELERLREQFHRDNLPIDSDILACSIDEDAFGSHVFVQQLRLIELAQTRLVSAMRHYYRASEQRSRWLREGLLRMGELTQYDRRLCEEWQLRFDAMIQEMGDQAAEAEMRTRAQQLYSWAEHRIVLPIRPACDEPFVPRGSLQLLADDQKIGWHPKFPELLRALLPGPAS